MAQALAFARSVEVSPVETLRTIIVGGCAAALIMAGQFLPALGL
ncbi:hypothetical protein [Allopontixanthobacter sediminis]|nr:hypothetical protein [Allopontixanthobacter sediminis]